MIRYRRRLMPPADLSTLQHIDRKANPIRHYRLETIVVVK